MDVAAPLQEGLKQSIAFHILNRYSLFVKRVKGDQMRILLLVFFLSTLGFSKDILSVNLSTDFTYSDLDSSCHLYPLGKKFTLAAELEGGEILNAKLRRPLMDKTVVIIELNEEEMGGIEFQNNNGYFILTRLAASPRILSMLFQGGSEEINKCVPAEELISTSPSNFVFEFTAPSPDEKLPIKTHSNKAIFNGTTKSGKTYRIELILNQEHY